MKLIASVLNPVHNFDARSTAMLSLLTFKNCFLSNGRVLIFQLKPCRKLQTTRFVLAESVASNNDILFNATASMRKNKDAAKLMTDRIHYVSPAKRKQTRTPSTGHQNRKRTTLKWNTGSERAQAAANFTLRQVFKMNERGVVKVVNQTTNKLEETSILIWAGELDLQKHGLAIVDVEQRGTFSIPLVKLVESKTALKKYSDELAKQKEEELTRLGFSSKRTGRKNENDSNEDNLKQIKVSWQISDADLNKQKANEIISQLKKGYKVFLYMNGKDALNKSNWAEDITDEEPAHTRKHSDRELERRQHIVEQLQVIVNEFSLSPTVEGSIETRLIMKLSPKPVASKKEDRMALKEQRKRERQEKLERKLEKKKLRNSENY
ncbi:Aim23p [Lachancea thermotolerans CBS 6340]|uniref:Altered inheritance of mitochondria protein 23, mitochondrial n=1 Tax=Lachancea thermotolerans (strain ATCC 56472 / CBS 6340 / NRRL Y-8284) TaxID=559295 RepID=AIM23_LACTC|nr:KLTH0F05852p [Lachancea thermotolerans CBS 6340]C5DKM2.1 RecName: Full=Altered inheritance of mitochondria protein 23, mitochondrial; Flags: Precursor [Lachancea thermotolerans CBS 6340]CAR24023.1 KLTH0F05852p [Lachancea thermotolerans CBS 6340]